MVIHHAVRRRVQLWLLAGEKRTTDVVVMRRTC